MFVLGGKQGLGVVGGGGPGQGRGVGTNCWGPEAPRPAVLDLGPPPNPRVRPALTRVACRLPRSFLSCDEQGFVHLWRFGQRTELASFTPVPGVDLGSWGSGGLLSMGSRLFSGVLAARLGGWGRCQALAWNPLGDGFAAIGEGGVVAAWQLGMEHSVDADGHSAAEWWHQVRTVAGGVVHCLRGWGEMGGRACLAKAPLVPAAPGLSTHATRRRCFPSLSLFPSTTPTSRTARLPLRRAWRERGLPGRAWRGDSPLHPPPPLPVRRAWPRGGGRWRTWTPTCWRWEGWTPRAT